jgi:hypothetical protein
MEREKTLQILKSLADGIDPASGEQLPAASSYQHPDTVRAIYSAIRFLETGSSPAQTSGLRKPGPENAGRPWSQEEDLRLGKAHDGGQSIDELAQAHKRSRWAIEARLARLGKIPEPPSGFASRSQRGNSAREPLSAYG